MPLFATRDDLKKLLKLYSDFFSDSFCDTDFFMCFL